MLRLDGKVALVTGCGTAEPGWGNGKTISVLFARQGATIAGVIIGVVALSVSLQALVAFAFVMVIYQQVENYVLQPTIIGRAARVSGFTVLTSVLAFGALFGFIGAIIGVPIAAGLQILVEELTAARRARIAAADLAEQQQPA